MRNTTIIILLLSCCFVLPTMAQETNNPQDYQQEVNADRVRYESFWEKVRFGGGFGMGFGEITNIILAPNAVYQLNPYVGAGVGLNGIYTRQRDAYTATVLGGSLIGLFNPIQEIQLSSEFEMLNVNRNFEDNFEAVGFLDENYWYPALFLGVGYNPGFMTIGFRYDVLYDAQKSIYANPFVPFVRFSF